MLVIANSKKTHNQHPSVTLKSSTNIDWWVYAPPVHKSKEKYSCPSIARPPPPPKELSLHSSLYRNMAKNATVLWKQSAFFKGTISRLPACPAMDILDHPHTVPPPQGRRSPRGNKPHPLCTRRIEPFPAFLPSTNHWDQTYPLLSEIYPRISPRPPRGRPSQFSTSCPNNLDTGPPQLVLWVVWGIATGDAACLSNMSSAGTKLGTFLRRVMTGWQLCMAWPSKEDALDSIAGSDICS